MNFMEVRRIFMTPQEIHNFFKEKEGSQSIAGIATLEAIVSLCKRDRPATILELGGGVGTISFALLKNCDATIDIYEQNDFCAKMLKENLKEMEGRYTIIPDYIYLPPKREYDLIVVDGGKGKGKDGGFPQVICSYINSLSSVKTIFVEGQRKSQKYWILEALRTRFLYTPTKYKDPTGGKKGCLQIDCRPCSSELLRIINHLYWRKKVY